MEISMENDLCFFTDASGRTAYEAAQTRRITPELHELVQDELHFFSTGLRYAYKRSLTVAAKSGQLEVVNRLLEADDDFSGRNWSLGPTALEEAAGGSHFEVVKRFLEVEKEMTSAESYFSIEALETATEHGHHEEMERLMKNRKTLETIRKMNDEALVAAGRQSDLRIVKALVEAGADLNAVATPRFETAITAAARAGHPDIVEYLIQRGADVNAAKSKNKPLGAAADRGHLTIVEKLIQAGAKADGQSLDGAAENGHLAVVRRILNVYGLVQDLKCIMPTTPALLMEDEFTALIHAAKGGQLEIVQLLLDSRADMNFLPVKAGRLALTAAAEKGSLEVVKVLLSAGAEFNAQTGPYAHHHSALPSAAKGGNLDVINLLLDSGCNIEEEFSVIHHQHNPALAVAAGNGRLDIVKRLLQKMGITNSVNTTLATAHCSRALYAATVNAQEDIVHYLLMIGTPVKVNFKSNYIGDLLSAAVTSGNINIVKLLLEAKVDLEAERLAGYRPLPLQVAVEAERIDLIELLLIAGSDVNAGKGRTQPSLHIASQKGNFEVVRVLLNAGADVDVFNYEGKTAFQVAENCGNEEVLGLLKAKQEEMAMGVAANIEKTWEIIDEREGIKDGSLCSICEDKLPDIFIGPRALCNLWAWHPSLTSLELSVKAGCPFCIFFRKQLDSDDWTLPQPSPVRLYYQGSSEKDAYISAQITEPYPKDIEYARKLMASFYLNVEPFEGKRKPLLGSTSSSQTFNQICSWLDICANGHKNCRCYQNTGFLPTRLIDLKALKDENLVRLIETKDMPRNDRNYITLSHDQHDKVTDFGRTTQASLKSNLTSISVKSLPLTFAHSIQVARELNVRFLWIATLCIIQDSEEDLERERGSIKDIYLNSYCTIAAAAASQTEKGIFRSIPTENLSVEFECTSSEGEKKRIQAFRKQRDWMLQYKNAPLSNSVRPLLERELSPRVLYFTEVEVLWECRTFKAMESWPGDNMPSDGLEPRILDSLADLGDGSVFDLWHKAVTQLTARTFEEEMNVWEAMAFLARLMRNKIEGQYIAGMWQKDLRRSLAWAPYASIRKRHTSYVAPSWSWASVNGLSTYQMLSYGNRSPLKPDFALEPCAFTITNLDLILASPSDEFSAVISAELHIRAIVIQGVLGYDRCSNCFGQMIVLSNAKGDARYGTMWFDVPSEREEMGLKVVSIVSLGITSLGLAIVPVKGRDGFYKRVGIVDALPAEYFVGKKSVDIILI